MDEKISPHFMKKEFACGCGCGFVIVNPALLYLLEAVREHFRSPLTITSACRCLKHNQRVGGKKKSRHIFGDAADIKVEGIPPAEVAGYCEKLVGRRGGVGRYGSFTHVDVRGNYARWRG